MDESTDDQSALMEIMPATVEVDEPKLSDIPEKVQQFLCLRACGFSTSSIAKLAKIDPRTVSGQITKYDPDNKVTLTVKERKAFLAKLWEARATEALLHITPDKMEASDARSLAGIAAVATKSAKALQSVEAQEDRDPLGIIEALCG